MYIQNKCTRELRTIGNNASQWMVRLLIARIEKRTETSRSELNTIKDEDALMKDLEVSR